MNSGLANDVLRDLCDLIAAELVRDVADGELLERFLHRRDDSAFALIVQRHGPMVWGVCRRVLRDVHQAEDAFQATFLVLFRKAGSIHKSDSLGSWLHGVAYRVATKARTRLTSRQTCASGKVETAGPDSFDELAWEELRAVLDEELSRLPRKYRDPVVLCYLQDKTQEEAARELGCPRSSLSSRLGKARALLQERLTRRGLTLSLAGLLAVLTDVAARAEAPAPLLATALRDVPFAASGQASAVSTQATILAEVVMQTMTTTKVTTAMTLFLTLTVGLSTSLVLGGPAQNRPRQEEPAPATIAAVAPEEEVTPFFRDVTAASGVNFTYRNGEEASQYTLLESLGGGVALFDFDEDGWLDLFIVGGGDFDGDDRTQIKPRPCKLYRNLGNGKFEDLTKKVGLDQIPFYTHGVAVGDYDCDGWPDLLVTGYGQVALFHNEPDGKGGRRFVDVTRRAGLNDDLWSTSAAWADFDGDGYPDLYVCHYVDWSFKKHPKWSPDGKARDVPPPKLFNPQPHKVYRNNRDGTFTDVSKEAGLRVDGKGLGVVVVDFDGDGKPDVFVGNDTDDKFLYRNRSERGKIRFEEIGLQAGVARDDRGVPTGGGGVAVGDFDNSGVPSILVTSYAGEMPSLYQNLRRAGQSVFQYVSPRAGLGRLPRSNCGWGVGLIDLDLDGRLDLFIANGHVLRHPPDAEKVAQSPTLLRNDGGKFADVGDQGGPYFQKEHRGRGVALGDLDNDGRIDLVISHLNEPVVILRNEAKVWQNHWLGIELQAKENRNVVGAQVTLKMDGGSTQTRQVVGGGSFASASDSRLVFGLGAAKRIDKLTVKWPGGSEQTWEGLAVDRYHRVVEGKKDAGR